MIKYTMYHQKNLMSTLIEGRPFVKMEDVLEAAIPGSWSDYRQVLNSDHDLQVDLDISDVPFEYGVSGYYIPVENLRTWLFTLKLREVEEVTRTRFRLFRRDVENALRVTWGLPVTDELCFSGMEYECPEYNYNTQDLARYFSVIGIKELVCEEDSMVLFLLNNAAHSECGKQGEELVDILTYIEELPGGDMVLDYIEDSLRHDLPYGEGLDFLEDLNRVVSYLASKFYGGHRAQ